MTPSGNYVCNGCNYPYMTGFPEVAIYRKDTGSSVGGYIYQASNPPPQFVSVDDTPPATGVYQVVVFACACLDGGTPTLTGSVSVTASYFDIQQNIAF
jgi:hypothetical protein